jgi:hypothetical protein
VNPKIELTPEDREALLAWLSNGETLHDWIRGPGSNYKRSVVYARVNDDPELTAAFKVSRQVGADEMADRIHTDIYAEPERIVDQSGVRKIDPAYVALVKMRAEIMLKLLAKWNSGKYGDKVTNEISGPNGGPVQVEGVTVKLVRPDAG